MADTVDYGEVCQLAALIAQQRSYRTLERLATAIADRLLDDFDVHSVMVKASKPEPPIPLPVDEASVDRLAGDRGVSELPRAAPFDRGATAVAPAVGGATAGWPCSSTRRGRRRPASTAATSPRSCSTR